MNFRYRVDDQDFVLSEQEDKFVTDQIKAGAKVVFLRENKLAINVNFIRYRRETSNLTEQQEAENQSRLQLSPAPSSPESGRKEFLRKMHFSTYSLFKWDHEARVCRDIHPDTLTVSEA